MPLPFRQPGLADALGLSLVHTNRALKGLARRRLARWTEGALRIPDPGALAEDALVKPGPVEPRPLM